MTCFLEANGLKKLPGGQRIEKSFLEANRLDTSSLKAQPPGDKLPGGQLLGDNLLDANCLEASYLDANCLETRYYGGQLPADKLPDGMDPIGNFFGVKLTKAYESAT